MEIEQVGVWLVVMLVSMLPVVEARFGIPIGLASDIWGVGTLEVWQAMLAGIIGSTTIGIVIILCYQPIKKWCRRYKWYNMMVGKYKAGLRRSINKNYRAKMWALCAFLALPIPGSGVWSCAILGCIMNLKTRDNIIVMVVGNIISCLCVSMVSAVLIEYITLVLLVGGIMCAMWLVYRVLEKIVNCNTKKQKGL